MVQDIVARFLEIGWKWKAVQAVLYGDACACIEVSRIAALELTSSDDAGARGVAQGADRARRAEQARGKRVYQFVQRLRCFGPEGRAAQRVGYSSLKKLSISNSFPPALYLTGS